MKRILFVTGFQKSGTSLLNRLLMSQNFIENPFLPEGKFFWGDNPVENPVDSPCGEIYQKHKGRQGHQLYRNDFQKTHKELLEHRIKSASIKKGVLMNKNPNLVVRLPWLKQIFPDSKIILIIRKPIANIYSFSKKLYEAKRENPDYWWGVKPDKWQSLINKNEIVQIVNQWKSVFHELINNYNLVDMIIRYDRLCINPYQHLVEICNILNIDLRNIQLDFNELQCMDEEYKKGSEIQSKNIHLRNGNSFNIPTSEKNDYEPFDNTKIDYIQSETDEIWSLFLDIMKEKIVT